MAERQQFGYGNAGHACIGLTTSKQPAFASGTCEAIVIRTAFSSRHTTASNAAAPDAS